MGRFTTIGVPVELRDKLKMIAEKKGVAMWQLISDMLSFYEMKMKRGYGTKYEPKVEITPDKVAYYIMKLSYSVSVFKLNPSKENLEWLRKTCKQVQERLGVDTSILIRSAEVYYKTREEQDMGNLNMAWKSVILALISLVCA